MHREWAYLPSWLYKALYHGKARTIVQMVRRFLIGWTRGGTVWHPGFLYRPAMLVGAGVVLVRIVYGAYSLLNDVQMRIGGVRSIQSEFA